MTTTKPKPYIPRPWQLPHLLATPVGGKVLIVERCEEQPPKGATDWGGNPYLNLWHWTGMATIECGPDFEAPLGPVGTVLACKERWAFLRQTAEPMLDTFLYHAGASAANLDFVRWRTARCMPLRACRLFVRTTAIDLRRVDTMTEEEAAACGCPGVRPQERIRRRRGEWIVTPLNEAKGHYLADNAGSHLGDWAWFITADLIRGRTCLLRVKSAITSETGWTVLRPIQSWGQHGAIVKIGLTRCLPYVACANARRNWSHARRAARWRVDADRKY